MHAMMNEDKPTHKIIDYGWTVEHAQYLQVIQPREDNAFTVVGTGEGRYNAWCDALDCLYGDGVILSIQDATSPYPEAYAYDDPMISSDEKEWLDAEDSEFHVYVMITVETL